MFALGDVSSCNLLRVLLKDSFNWVAELIFSRSFEDVIINDVFFSYRISIRVINLCFLLRFSFVRAGKFSIKIKKHFLAISK